MIEVNDTQGQQNPDGDDDHSDPGRKARYFLQDRDGRQGVHNRYGREKDRRRASADI